MDIRVSGHQIETGAALREHVEDRLNSMIEKYFSRALSAHVTFGKAPAGAFGCDIVMHVQHGMILKGSAQAHDAHQAFDAAAEKIDKQLRRYKRRLKDHHTQAAHAREEEDAAYTIFAGMDDSEPDTGDSGGEIDEAADAPLIVAESSIDIPESSVADAVMMLDLRDTNAMFFKNGGTGRHNMVYRRRDGSIGWVEPR